MTRGNRSSSRIGANSDSLESDEILNQLESNDSKILLTALKSYCKDLIEAKDREIAILNQKVDKLEETVNQLSNKLGEQEGNYEDALQAAYKDTYILSGPELPAAAQNENCKETVISTFRSALRLVISPDDIQDATRIGRIEADKQDRRPIRIKLRRMDTRKTLGEAFRSLRPKLYLNDFLTINRRNLLDRCKKIKNDHPQFVKVVYVRNGNIFVKKSIEGERIPIKSSYNLDNYIKSLSDSNIL